MLVPSRATVFMCVEPLVGIVALAWAGGHVTAAASVQNGSVGSTLPLQSGTECVCECWLGRRGHESTPNQFYGSLMKLHSCSLRDKFGDLTKVSMCCCVCVCESVRAERDPCYCNCCTLHQSQSVTTFYRMSSRNPSSHVTEIPNTEAPGSADSH